MDFINALKSTPNQTTGYLPTLFNLSDSKDKTQLEALLHQNPNIAIFDSIEGQLKELIKLRHPTINHFTKEDIQQKITSHLNGVSIQQYGVWVYYPWIKKLVHILPKEEFIEVRTNRNQYKITKEEQNILSKQKIGVIGLSVGQSVALTLTMERSYGEIRLADFDVLELSNLNRIRTPLYNLDVPKVITVAREIKEIDPFLEVKCFPEGITKDNLHDFLTHGGKLNILIDECDGLEIKIACRLKARELGIPVVMEASDRGTTDVERFDLEKQRPILHGLIDHLDLELLKHAKTNEEKIPYALPMLGIDTTSERMKASMLEIEQSITTWPQLASAVTLGGGISADVCRRIALNQFHESGRYHVDLEDLIGNKTNQNPSGEDQDEETPNQNTPTSALNFQSIIQYQTNTKEIKGQLILQKNQIEAIVSASILAPSGGNCQPWKWLWSDKTKTLNLFFDAQRSLSLLDFKNNASFLSLGAAVENAILKAHAMNLEVQNDVFPIAGDNRLVASLKFFSPSNQPPFPCDHQYDGLEKYITSRCTNRTIASRIALEYSTIEQLRKATSSIEGCQLLLTDGENQLKEMAELIAQIDRILLTNKVTHAGFMKEIRWTPQEAMEKKDGVDLAAIDLTPTELIGFKIARKWSVVKHLNHWKKGSAFEKLTKRSINAASHVALVTIPAGNDLNFYKAGRAIQRMWLTAHSLNVSLHPYYAGIAFFAHLNAGNTEIWDSHTIGELKEIRKKFKAIFSIGESTEAFLVKLSVAGDPQIKSYRKPLNEVLTFE